MIVDPMSIIGSAQAQRHLADLAKNPIWKQDSEKPTRELQDPRRCSACFDGQIRC